MTLNRVLQILGTGGLLLILTITLLYAGGKVTFDNYSLWLLAGTLVWFAGIITAGIVKRRTQPPEI